MELLDLPDELLDLIVEMCLFTKDEDDEDDPVEAMGKLKLSAPVCPSCHQPMTKHDEDSEISSNYYDHTWNPEFTIGSIRILSAVNKRIAQVLEGTWTYRDLKLLHLAALDANVEYEFYPDSSFLLADRFFPKKMILLAQNLSKFHPLRIEVDTQWNDKAMAAFINQFTRFLSNTQTVAIEAIVVQLPSHDEPEDNELDRRFAMFAELIKLFKAKSTEGDNFYLNIDPGDGYDEYDDVEYGSDYYYSDQDEDGEDDYWVDDWQV